MELIIASKAEFPDIWEFGKSSIKKMWEWERRGGYTDQSLEERYSLSVNRKAGPDEIAGIIAHLQKMEWVDFVDFQEEQIIHAMVLFKPRWNLEIYAIETGDTYLYMEWGTTV